MASITLCPRCSSHLELPSGIAPTSLVECPICEAEFLLASVAPRAVPKARVVDHDSAPNSQASEGSDAATLDAAPPLGIVVEDASIGSSEPTLAAEDRLSRLLRSSASWQLPGLQPPQREENADAADDDGEIASSLHLETPGDRVIPNDHAPTAATFGATLDAAYRDADPALTADSSTPADKLQLAGSRLDQLLSDLMKPQTVAAAAPAAEPVQSRDVIPAVPEFAEFVDEAQGEESAEIDRHPSAEHVHARHDSQSLDDGWDQQSASVDEASYDSDEMVDDVDDEDADAVARTDDFVELDLSTAPRRQRRSSGVRTLVGIVGGGAIGILGGAYALLWLRPEVDLLRMADWLPPAMLPAATQSQPESNLAEQGLLAPPAAVETSGGADGGDTTAPLASSTLAFADSAEETPSSAEPMTDDVADASGVAATPPVSGNSTVRQDPLVAPAAATEPMTEATEPPTVAPAVAQTPVEPATNWPTTSIVGQLRGVNLATVASLDAQLAGADAAHRRFLAGDLSRKEDVAGMGQAYIELCKLAELFTLTDPREFGNELITKQMNAKNIFRGALGDPARRNDLAMIAGRWLQHERRPNQGVVVLGKITDMQAHGSWTEYTLATPLGDATATSKVLMEGPPFKSGSEIAVVGAIVADPRQAIAGYTGDAPQVIVSGFAFVPEVFVAPMLGTSTGEPNDLFSLGE